MIKPKNYEKKEKKAQGSRDALSKIKPSIANLRSGDGVVRHEARETLTFIGKQRLRVCRISSQWGESFSPVRGDLMDWGMHCRKLLPRFFHPVLIFSLDKSLSAASAS
jgi:hypothetical protein